MPLKIKTPPMPEPEDRSGLFTARDITARDAQWMALVEQQRQLIVQMREALIRVDRISGYPNHKSILKDVDQYLKDNP